MGISQREKTPRPFDRLLERVARVLWVVIGVILCIGLISVSASEMRSSNIQAHFLSRFVHKLTYQVQPGPSSAIRFPVAGPYDLRLGYSRLPGSLNRLSEAGYEIEAQASFSPSLLEVSDWGIFPPYKEKQQAGLRILDRSGKALFEALFPERIYESFDSIPPVIVDTLLFIENREMLNPRYPVRNPAIEWDRFAKAALEYTVGRRDPNRRGPGGSTLATQIEKARHSPDGVTSSASEKLRQIASASLRAYLDGERTLEAQRRVVLTYVNSLPLAAVPGHGEVIGLADGLQMWYGADFEAVSRLLWSSEPVDDQAEDGGRSRAYRQVLSLLLAQRRPTYFLLRDRAVLETLTDAYLRLLANHGVITKGLRDRALATKITFRELAVRPPPFQITERRSANIVRAWLVSQLGLSSYYDLDRLDLAIESTLDRAAQDAVVKMLHDLVDPNQVEALGLRAARLLEQGDPAGIVFSILLYERGNGANWLRIQADNLNQAFRVADGAKLDLGSTAKLRALVSYLEIIAALHQRYAGLPPETLREIEVYPSDQLTRWSIEWIANHKDSSLETLLEAAMERRYSANPGERFFTGGGLHVFKNFDSKHDHQVLTVREAFHYSVNLVFIRLMRDIVNYYQFQVPGSTAKILEDSQDPQRFVYLQKFADREGRIFLNRFYRKYTDKSPEEALAAISELSKGNPRRLAAVLRFLEPDRSLEEFAERLRAMLPEGSLRNRVTLQLYEDYADDHFDLNDRGYLTRIHPLELWLVRYLRENPQASLEQVVQDSADERIAVYRWLFKTRHKKAQDLRIRSLLEIEAFLEIHRAWRRVGYPFDKIVPSYASAIGSSADRPSSLAELMGIIVNDGMRYPMNRVQRLRFAEGTPYETVVATANSAGERVLPAEVTTVLRRVLVETVERGTARRVYGVLKGADGQTLTVGGKTGTGDHREKFFSKGMQLVGERVVNRSAAFLFFIGERYFGIITAYVPGPEAAGYSFTSALPVHLFGVVMPELIADLDASDAAMSTPQF